MIELARISLRPLPWFLLCLALVLYFALVPVPPSGRLRELPRPVANWLNAHDDFANFAVFALLGILALALPQRGAGEGRWGGVLSNLSRTKVRLVGLMTLVGCLELAQRSIPGRSSDWRDVGMGILGVLAAWLWHTVRR